jgi:flagellar biosynthetic protein FlhB
MAEDNGDKTEAPTPRRRQEARDQGNIARSADLTAAMLLVGITLLISFSGTRIIDALRKLVESGLSGQLTLNGIRDLSPLMIGTTTHMMVAMLPMLVGTLLIAIFANWLQVGFHPNLKKLQPKFPFNPITGVKKLFGGGRGPVQMGMNILKLLLVGFVAYTAIAGKIATIVGIANLDVMQIFSLCAGLVYNITLRIGMVLLILSLLDFVYQKWKHEQDLKMTKQEVKDEMKRMDGDPKIKARRRQIQMQQAMKRIQTTVPTADVIVTNPTHFAIALKYDGDKMNAPRVVAKGADFLALKIREIAAEHGIPIIERPPLARALYKLCEVGHEIPEQFYSAVAEILAYVFELSGKAKRRLQPA